MLMMSVIFVPILLQKAYLKESKYYKYEKADIEREHSFHQNEALLNYNLAKDKCWYLPEINDQAKARYCFNAFMAAVPCPTLNSKAILALITLLGNYGLDVIEEWNFIQHKLHLAEYHFEMPKIIE